MKQWMQLPLALAMVAALACDRSDRANSGTVGTTGTGAESNVERDFIEDQLAAGNAEVDLGRLAQDRAGSPDVREFANMMVQDHQRAGDQLKAIANKQNVRAEAEAHDDHRDLQERLSKLSGAEFDREYMDAMVKDHEKAIDAVEAKAEKSDNADVKQWAAATLPSLKQHLDKANQIQSNLGSANNPK
jgi:putative membrane protein